MKILLLSEWLILALTFGFLHGTISIGKNRTKIWWLAHMLLSPFLWPMYLFELAVMKFFWKGAAAVAMWCASCLSIYVALVGIPDRVTGEYILESFVLLAIIGLMTATWGLMAGMLHTLWLATKNPEILIEP